jgi:hypothetical protein
MTFDESDPRTQARGARGADEAGRPAADHDEVVGRCRLGVAPLRRMDQVRPFEIEVPRRRARVGLTGFGKG